MARIPHPLKEALDKYAFEHDIPTIEALRIACAQLVGYAYPQPPSPAQQALTKRQRERRAQRRQLLRRLHNGEAS